MRFKFLLSARLTFLLFAAVNGMNVDLYLNKDKFGEYFKLEISEKGCTNVPLNWENQAASIDTHGSCIKFYDLPYCRGKFVALQPYHGTFQDNLATVGFDKIISSASPCGPKVPAGRYYLQNGADGSVLTIETRNGSAVARTKPFRPYITKGQQIQVEKVALADYELIPRVHEKMNPITFDMSVSTGSHPVRRTWKIESVYRGKYIIKNEWNNKCLYKSENGKVEEHECVIWSPNQEWMFRSIKVKPFFPSKEDLNKRPIRPYDDFPFDPQQLNDFNQVSQQLSSPGQKNRFRPKHPAVALGFNSKEPFPPVLPRPILPGPVLVNKKSKPKAPVPLVHHPGPLPFPPEPLVTVPRQPINGKKKPSAKVAKKKKNKDEDENEDEEDKKSEEKELDDLKSEEKDSEKKSEENDDARSEEKELEDKKSEEVDDKKSEEADDKKSEEADDKKSEEEKESEEKPSAESVEKEEEDDERDKRNRQRKTPIKKQTLKEEDDTYTPKYSDFRLYF